MSGTAELALDFFPVSIRKARHYLPWLWDRVFPAYGAQLCPKPFVLLEAFGQSIAIGWPVLLVVASLGVFIGCSLGASILRQRAFPGRFSWGCSFLFFALMNVGGIGYHCLPGRWLVFYILDVVGTAASSLSIIAGCLACRGYLDDRSKGAQRQLLRTYIGVLLVVTVAKLTGYQLVCELFYVLTMQLAGLAVLWLLSTRYPSQSQLLEKAAAPGDRLSAASRGLIEHDKVTLKRRSRQPKNEGDLAASSGVKQSKNVAAYSRANAWLVGSIVSVSLGFASVSLDRLFCRYEMSNWLAVVWVFAGCNLSFLCMFKSVNSYSVGV